MPGFIAGDGSFSVGITESSSSNKNHTVVLNFQITEHIRDIEFIKRFITYFGCGSVQIKGENVIDYRTRSYQDITEKIIPFFLKYQVLGRKGKRFVIFCEIAELMKQKAHLTPEGLKKILELKSKMK